MSTVFNNGNYRVYFLINKVIPEERHMDMFFVQGQAPVEQDVIDEFVTFFTDLQPFRNSIKVLKYEPM